MEGKEFFKIDGRELVVDKILVDYNGIAVFFVCKDNRDDYYIVSCADIDVEKYIVSKVPLSSLFKMLSGEISMRSLIMQPKTYWEVEAGEDFDSDVVLEKDMSNVPLDELPFEGACLQLATDNLRKYAEKIKRLLYNENWNRNLKSLDSIDECDLCKLTMDYSSTLLDEGLMKIEQYVSVYNNIQYNIETVVVKNIISYDRVNIDRTQDIKDLNTKDVQSKKYSTKKCVAYAA